MSNRSIREAMIMIFEYYEIKSRKDLDDWCKGKGRRKLYDEVERLAPVKCRELDDYTSSVRNLYQLILIGFKNSK